MAAMAPSGCGWFGPHTGDLQPLVLRRLPATAHLNPVGDAVRGTAGDADPGQIPRSFLPDVTNPVSVNDLLRRLSCSHTAYTE
jgi:hypothetical protein